VEAAAIIQERNNPLEAYLLGELNPADEEQIEVRLLTDPAFAEEFDITVDELIDRYAAGDFKGEQLERVEKYFLKAPERRQKLQFARALKQHQVAESSRQTDRLIPSPIAAQSRRAFTQYLPIAASVLVVIGLGFGVWRTFFYESPVRKGLLALQAAYREQRPLEARLSDFNYAPLANQRGGPVRVDYVQRDLAGSLLLLEAANNPNAASFHAIGQFYFVERKFDQAVDQFQKALALEPNNAKIHADLGAALLEEGKSLESPDGKGIQIFAESLTHLNKALDLDSTNLGALFNRALLHEQMGLLAQAGNDWRRYLEVESNSKWAEEARQNLQLVEEKQEKTSYNKEQIFKEFLKSYESHETDTSWRIVSSYHNRSGNVVVERLLDSYLEGTERGQNDEAQRNLQMLSYVAELEEQKVGDRFFSDLVQFYMFSNAKQRAAAIAARLLMKESYDGWGKFTVHRNLSLFTKAKELFDESKNFSESQVATYWIAFCHFRLHSQGESNQILERLLSACENRRYLWLEARGLYLKSAIEFEVNEHSKAVDFALQCSELAEQTDDQIGLLNAAGSLIEYYRYLGNYAKALRYVHRSIPLVTSISLDPIQGARHYSTVASAFATVGLYAAAEAYQREAMRLAVKSGAKAVMTYNYAFLGEINGKMGNVEEGLRNVRLAFQMAESNSNDSADRSSMAYFSLQMGNIYREIGDYDEALAHYTRSIDLYENLSFPTHLFQAYKGRLLCYVAQQQDELAKEEISKTLSMAEKYREQIKEENNRNTFFDVEQSVYDVAANFAYSRLDNSEEAFNYLELARARSLLDLLKADSEILAKIREPEVVIKDVSRPLTLSQLRSGLPEGVQILQYAVLEDKVLIWLISRETHTVVASAIARTELSKRVARYLQVTSTPNENERQIELQLAKELFGILITPVQPGLSKDKQICIIPDKMLEYLPFPALISPVSGRYLIEDYSLLRSPSPSVFIAATQSATERVKSKREKLLSVGNPRFDRAAFPDLPDLPSARSEAVKSAEYYDAAVQLIDSEAGPVRVKDEMQRAEVIHLALHSALDADVPLRSKLVLAKSADDRSTSAQSVLYAYEIYNLKLPGSRLLVLSACQTGAERYYGGEGTASLARAFLAAGVPLVVASLWPVDSTATEQLMVSFHRHRKQEQIPAVDALTKAQRDMLSNPDARFRRPYYWAAFTVTGGYATF